MRVVSSATGNRPLWTAYLSKTSVEVWSSRPAGRLAKRAPGACGQMRPRGHKLPPIGQSAQAVALFREWLAPKGFAHSILLPVRSVRLAVPIELMILAGAGSVPLV